VVSSRESGGPRIEPLREDAAGTAEEQCQKGKDYFHGKGGVERDTKEAVAWYRKAAEQEQADAQYSLGMCYEKGEGVEQDNKEAKTWCLKAAKQGHEEAVAWCRRAAEQGDADAQFELGQCYANGRGVEKDAKEAVAWYRKAAAQDSADAQHMLGVCYIAGKGVEKDVSQCLTWFKKAAKQGHAGAQFKIGVITEIANENEENPEVGRTQTAKNQRDEYQVRKLLH